MLKIIDVHVADIRFPTSHHSDGSDAMNPDPDYSATYVTLIINSAFNGNGLTFTIGRGNELCVAAVHALKFMLINKDLVEITRDMGAFWRSLVGDSQLRWVDPEKAWFTLRLQQLLMRCGTYMQRLKESRFGNY